MLRILEELISEPLGLKDGGVKAEVVGIAKSEGSVASSAGSEE